ncbi:MAG: hypothetical protein ACK50E_01780 [Bacteroidota bacterium]|jgi:hypothetical protein
MKNKNSVYFLELLSLFLILSGFVFFSDQILHQYTLDSTVLWSGNLLLFGLSLLSLFMHTKGASDKNPNVFFRSVYASMLLRMMGVLCALLIYLSIKGAAVNQPAVLICIVFYFVYTFYEIRIVFRMLKKTDDGKGRSSDSVSR